MLSMQCLGTKIFNFISNPNSPRSPTPPPAKAKEPTGKRDVAAATRAKPPDTTGKFTKIYFLYNGTMKN